MRRVTLALALIAAVLSGSDAHARRVKLPRQHSSLPKLALGMDIAKFIAEFSATEETSTEAGIRVFNVNANSLAPHMATIRVEFQARRLVNVEATYTADFARAQPWAVFVVHPINTFGPPKTWKEVVGVDVTHMTRLESSVMWTDNTTALALGYGFRGGERTIAVVLVEAARLRDVTATLQRRARADAEADARAREERARQDTEWARAIAEKREAEARGRQEREQAEARARDEAARAAAAVAPPLPLIVAAPPAPPPEPQTGAPPARRGFQLAFRAGYAQPFGNASGEQNDSMSNSFGGHVPLLLEIGGKPAERLFLGGYVGLGVGRAAGVVDRLCSDQQVSCLPTSFRVGVELQAHLLPAAAVDPWIGYGAGFEMISVSVSDSLGNSASASGMGVEFAHLMAGLDLRVSRGFGFGPFVDLALGIYTQVKTTDERGVVRSDSIGNYSLHAWVIAGLRFVVLP